MKLVKNSKKVVPLRQRKDTVQNVIKDFYHTNTDLKCVIVAGIQKDGTIVSGYSSSYPSERILIAEVIKNDAMKIVMGS